jgi:hypothetical protein
MKRCFLFILLFLVLFPLSARAENSVQPIPLIKVFELFMRSADQPRFTWNYWDQNPDIAWQSQGTEIKNDVFIRKGQINIAVEDKEYYRERDGEKEYIPWNVMLLGTSEEFPLLARLWPGQDMLPTNSTENGLNFEALAAGSGAVIGSIGSYTDRNGKTTQAYIIVEPEKQPLGFLVETEEFEAGQKGAIKIVISAKADALYMTAFLKALEKADQEAEDFLDGIE